MTSLEVDSAAGEVRRRRLGASAEALVRAYDCAMLDLDGVVYVGPSAVPGAPELLHRARSEGMTLAYVTNNASRTAAEVARQLRDLDVPARDRDVVTSAQAAAREIADRFGTGARVLVVGGDGLTTSLRERGLLPVSSRTDGPVAVAQGFHPDVGWRLLAEGAAAIRQGAWWIASNLDLTLPTADGPAPGNGALVNAIAAAVGHGPDAVAGKPFRPLFDETVRRVGASRPLVVGDRLDTDIEGAVRCGADSLLVMTGVTDLGAAMQAAPGRRPTYVSATLEGLLTPHEEPTAADDGWTLGGWTAHAAANRVVVTSQGERHDDGLRVACSAAWAWQDDHGEAVSALVGWDNTMDWEAGR
jgi:HAD superfamily hydrolase (TIGR01450 family)